MKIFWLLWRQIRRGRWTTMMRIMKVIMWEERRRETEMMMNKGSLIVIFSILKILKKQSWKKQSQIRLWWKGEDMPKISIPIRCRILISLLQASYLIWTHYLIGLEKLPQNDPRHFEICPLDQKLWRYLFPCQLMCTVTSPFDLAWKTNPKWLFNC